MSGGQMSRGTRTAGSANLTLPADLESHDLETPGWPLPSPAENGGEPYESSVLELLILLARRRRLLLRATVAAAVLGGAAALLLPNRYTATANILPPQPSQSLAASMIGQLGALGPVAAMAQKDLGLKNPNDLYIGMLRSRSAADALIRRFDLLRAYREEKMSEARRDLENASRITLGKEGFVSISVEDRDPGRAAQIANAYVDELRRLTQNLAVTEAGQRRLFFEGQLELARNHLADAEQALKTTEQQTGLIELDGQARAIIEAVGKLRAQLAAKEVELHAMRLFSTDQNPDVLLAEQELSGLRQQLARLEEQSGVRNPSGSGSNRVSGGVSGAVSMDGAEGEADGASDRLQLPAGNVPEAGLQYLRRLRDVKYAETMFEMLAKQYEAARLDEAKTAAVIQVLDPAIVPDRKSSPPRTLLVAMAALLGFITAVGYVFLAEAFRRMGLDPQVKARWSALRQTVFQADFESGT